MRELTEQPELTRDWLNVLSLSDHEHRSILGMDPRFDDQHRAEFNMLAEFLRREVGFPDPEIPEWLRSGMTSLGGKRPLDRLLEPGGFDEVWGLALKVADEVREDLSGRETSPEITKHAEVLAAADYLRQLLAATGEGRDQVWDDRGDESVCLRRQTAGDVVEGFIVSMPDGGPARHRRAFITLFQFPNRQPEVFKAGVAVFMTEQPEKNVLPHDLSPLIGSAELEPFIDALRIRHETSQLVPV